VLRFSCFRRRSRISKTVKAINSRRRRGRPALSSAGRRHGDYCAAIPLPPARNVLQWIETIIGCNRMRPLTFRTGSCSANDATFAITAELASRVARIRCQAATCQLAQQLDSAVPRVHYAHAANRLLKDNGSSRSACHHGPGFDALSGGHPQISL